MHGLIQELPSAPVLDAEWILFQLAAWRSHNTLGLEYKH